MDSQSKIGQFDHFIPVSTSHLIQVLSESELDSQQIEAIHKLKQVISFQFQQKLVTLKKLYQPFNPDRELLLESKKKSDIKTCIHDIHHILTAANYTELNQQQIEYALQKTSPYGLEIRIDFSAFSDINLFYRGKSSRQVQLRDWKTLYLKKKSVSLISYQRLFLLLRYKNQETKPGLHLKLFKDILRPDLEMLFPDCKIRMKAFDKIKLAITGGGGTAGGLFATIGKITAAVSPWTIAIAIGGFALLIWRQLSKIFIQKTRYMATLAQNLYFHNLDNNAGAITYLVDMARQEEIKETVLAYAMINLQEIKNSDELDSACENWFEKTFKQQIDFDIGDALNKLRQLDIIHETGDQIESKQAEQLIIDLEKKWLTYMQSN